MIWGNFDHAYDRTVKKGVASFEKLEAHLL